MKRLLLGLATAGATLALPAAAHAYTAYAVTDLNVRACGSTQCVAIAVIPAGGRVNVLGSSGGWHYLTFSGVTGYASAKYITTRLAAVRPSRPAVVASYPVYPAYPVYPTYYDYYAYQPGFAVRPGFSLSFRFGR
jgi:uncharacterized protein YraI